MVGRQLLKASTKTQDAHAALRESTAKRHADIETLLALRRPFGRAHYLNVLRCIDGDLSPATGLT